MTLFLILRNLAQKWRKSVCLALRNILFLFLMYHFIVVVVYEGSEGLIVTTQLGIHSLAMCNILLVRLRTYISTSSSWSKCQLVIEASALMIS